MLPDKSAENVIAVADFCNMSGRRVSQRECVWTLPFLHCSRDPEETESTLGDGETILGNTLGFPWWGTLWEQRWQWKILHEFSDVFFAFPGYQRVAPLWPLLLRLGLWQSWIVLMVLSVLYICQAVGYLQYPSANSSAGWKHIMMIM